MYWKINRVSKDNKINNSGQRLIDICKNHNLFILNGRFGQDNHIGAMTFRNTSVLDYAIVSSNVFEILSDFWIKEVDRLFSDCHSLLSVSLHVRYNSTIGKSQTNKSRDQIPLGLQILLQMEL